MVFRIHIVSIYTLHAFSVAQPGSVVPSKKDSREHDSRRQSQPTEGIDIRERESLVPHDRIHLSVGVHLGLPIACPLKNERTLLSVRFWIISSQDCSASSVAGQPGILFELT